MSRAQTGACDRMNEQGKDEHDRELLERVRKGDRPALDELLRQHQAKLLGIAANEMGAQLKGRLRPSDVVQSTLLDAVQSLDTFRGESPEAFGAWMTCILKNNLRDRARFYTRERRDARREISGLDLVQLSRHTSPTPSEEYTTAEELERLGRAMARISTNHRRVLSMRLLDQLPHEEIAKKLELTIPASRQLLARARASLMLELTALERRGQHDDP